LNCLNNNKMTKVQLPFKLAVPLDEDSLRRLASVTGIYGILRVTPDPEGQSLTVEYDATRFGPKDVEAALARAGLPLAERSIP
jgi:hypothetical protein